MLWMLRRLQKVDSVTLPIPDALNQIEGKTNHLPTAMAHAVAIRAVDAGSCNGCELEIHAMNGPRYDAERFGIHFVASPRHADLLLVTGSVTCNMETALRMTWDATPAPKGVVAVGECAASGGVLGCGYASRGAVKNIIPVNVTVHGCPPPPGDILRAILRAVGRE